MDLIASHTSIDSRFIDRSSMSVKSAALSEAEVKVQDLARDILERKAEVKTDKPLSLQISLLDTGLSAATTVFMDRLGKRGR